MPQIQQYDQRTRASGPLGAGPVESAAGGIALGRAIGGVGDVLAQQKEREGAVWATDKLNQAQGEWSAEIEKRKQNAPNGAPDFTPGVLKDFDSYSTDLSKDAPTRSASDFLKQRLGAFRTALQSHALEFEAQQRVANSERITAQSADVGATLAYQSPQAFPDIVAERNALIDGQGLPAQMAAKLKDDTQQKIAYSAVLGMAETDPANTFKLLSRPAGSSGVLAIEALPFDDRVKLLNYAQRSALSDIAASDKATERAQKAAEGEAQKDGDVLVASGALTQSWLEKNRAKLSPESFQYFAGQLKPKPESEKDGPKNIGRYAMLREMVSLGEDVRDEARDAFQEGDIRFSDYNTLLNEAEGTYPNAYKLGVQKIATAAAVSEINPDPAAAQRKAKMLDDFAQWRQTNPKAEPLQMRDEADRIISEYGLVDYQQMLMMQRKPRFLVGTRNEPDFSATAQQTKDAFDRGELTPDQYSQQKDVIVKLKEAYDKWQGAQTK